MKAEPRSGQTGGQPSIAYDAQGAGDAIVFLHGIGGNRRNWAGQLAFFSRHYRAVAWDARGYGDSGDYGGPCRFEDFSGDLCRLLDHLELERAHLVGLSMGGRILMDFGWRHPSRVRSLTMAGSFPSFGAALTPDQQKDFMRLRRQPLEQGLSLADLAPQLVASLLGPQASDAARTHMLDSIGRLRAPSYLKTLEATLYFDRSRELPAITAPTLLLYGEFDTLVTPEAGRAVHAAMPHADYRVVPKAGHLINLEQPDGFNEAVMDFLARLAHCEGHHAFCHPLHGPA